MTEMIEAIYPLAIEQGMLPDLFWELSVLEVLDILDAHDRKLKAEQKRDVELAFVLADAIGSRIGYIFADESKRDQAIILQPWDLYPDLFTKEKAESAAKREAADLAKYKAGVAAYAARWNMRKRNVDESI